MGGDESREQAGAAAGGGSGDGEAAWAPNAVGALVSVLPQPAAGLTVAAASEWLLLGAADGGGAWRVARAGGGGEELVAAAGSLRRAAPARGDRARAVLGSLHGFEGEVLSVNDGLAVVRGGGGDGKPARVKHFPVDALCRLLARS